MGTANQGEAGALPFAAAVDQEHRLGGWCGLRPAGGRGQRSTALRRPSDATVPSTVPATPPA
jgi:hypothetical protein